MAGGYRPSGVGLNSVVNGLPHAPGHQPVAGGGLRGLCVLMVALVLAGGCRLPAREWRWGVSGNSPTWLDSLGEQRGCDLVARAWVPDRAMWPLPLPGSRRLFFGADDLFVLIILDNHGERDAAIAPSRARLRMTGSGGSGPARPDDARCEAAAPPGGRTACTFRVAAPRGEEKLVLDLTDALPCDYSAFVFQLERETSWKWRRVGPGVPGL